MSVDKEIRERIRALPEIRLIKMWCELNTRKWPDEFADIKPDGYPAETTERHAQTLGWCMMEEIRFTIADKAISRYWNRERMTTEQFERWYPAQNWESLKD